MQEVTIKWCIEDVKAMWPEATQEQAEHVLYLFDRYHDGSMEAMWQDLQLHVDNVKAEDKVTA